MLPKAAKASSRSVDALFWFAYYLLVYPKIIDNDFFNKPLDWESTFLVFGQVIIRKGVT